jgi:multiple sugar transport system substrate-binding protein
MTRAKLAPLMTILGVAAVLAGCGSAGGSGSGGSSGAFSPRDKVSIKGQEISVLLPYKGPQSILSDFTRKTGVKVNFNVAGWDAVHSKLVVANTASTYIADVTEFDWSFTGQFAGAKWYEPLESALAPALVQDLAKTDSAFKSGGHLYAACYSNDFRMSVYNKKMFAKAGVTGFPKTFGEFATAIAQLKKAGVQYPVSIAMGSTEGAVTPWYLLTLAMGGQLFDNNFKPLFTDPSSAGHKALQWEVDAVKNGWVSPGAVTLDDGPAFDKFTAGANAISFASGPGNFVTANDKSQSSIAPNAAPGLIPGISGPGNSFGLPEGLGIPVSAKRKDAARAFIEWWEQPATSTAIYKATGTLPCRGSVIGQLGRDGSLQGGDVIGQQLSHVVPLFPNGAPPWYSNFSSEAQGLINAAAKGSMSVSDALTKLGAKATSLAHGGA